MNIERRAVRAEVRAPAEGRTFEATVMQYGIVDDYDTVFDPGVFTRSLEARMPRLTWGHDWTDLIGRVVDYKDTDETLTIVGELDDFDAVPRARQAYAQLQSGSLDNFSVGFRRSETRDNEGRTHFVRATLDEVALVLSAAVPGTELVGVRSARQRLARRGASDGGVSWESALEDALGPLYDAGTITKAQLLGAFDGAASAAGIALDLAAGSTASASPAGVGAGASLPEDPAPELDGDALDALGTLGFA